MPLPYWLNTDTCFCPASPSAPVSLQGISAIPVTMVLSCWPVVCNICEIRCGCSLHLTYFVAEVQMVHVVGETRPDEWSDVPFCFELASYVVRNYIQSEGGAYVPKNIPTQGRRLHLSGRDVSLQQPLAEDPLDTTARADVPSASVACSPIRLRLWPLLS